MAKPEIKLSFERAEHVSEEEKNRQFRILEDLGWREGVTFYLSSGKSSVNPRRSISARTYFWPHETEPVIPDDIRYLDEQ